MLLAPCSHFTQTHYGNNGILISCMSTCKTSIAFFQTEYIIVGVALFKELNLLTDILETGQHFHETYPVSLCNGTCHIGGNNSRNQCRISRHGLRCGTLS